MHCFIDILLYRKAIVVNLDLKNQLYVADAKSVLILSASATLYTQYYFLLVPLVEGLGVFFAVSLADWTLGIAEGLVLELSLIASTSFIFLRIIIF